MSKMEDTALQGGFTLWNSGLLVGKCVWTIQMECEKPGPPVETSDYRAYEL